MDKKAINQFLKEIDPKILQRGQAYYDSGQVGPLETDGLQVSAEVYGSGARPYLVEIAFSEDGEISDWSCDCPYDWGDVCKHTAAVLLAIQKTPVEKTEKVKKPNVRKLVGQAEKEQLASLILEHCREDKRFQAKVLSRLCCSGSEEMEAIRNLVKNSIRSNTHHGYIDEWDCNNICTDLDESLEKAEHRIQQGEYGLAMEIGLFIFMEGTKLAGEADSSSGALGESLGTALDIIGQSAGGLAGKERTTWLRRILDSVQSSVFDGWEEFRYDLLRKTAVLTDKENEDDFLAVLDDLNNARRKDSFSYSWYASQDRLIRYQLTERLQGPEKARAYLEAHLEDDKLREILTEKLIAKKNYARAESLCLEKVNEAPVRHWGKSDQWQYLLYEIYRKWGREEKQMEQARKLALLGDRDFYNTAKKLLTRAGRWEKEFPDFLAEYKAARSSYEYMNLLEREGQTALLMEAVRQEPRTAFRYGETLATTYSGEICGLCAGVIRVEAERIDGRKDYQRICGEILELSRFGGSEEARAIIEELRVKYPRRRALLEELKQAEGKI